MILFTGLLLPGRSGNPFDNNTKKPVESYIDRGKPPTSCLITKVINCNGGLIRIWCGHQLPLTHFCIQTIATKPNSEVGRLQPRNSNASFLALIFSLRLSKSAAQLPLGTPWDVAGTDGKPCIIIGNPIARSTLINKGWYAVVESNHTQNNDVPWWKPTKAMN